MECRKDQLIELSNFVEDKTKQFINDPDHLVLVCGDFNINPLKESDENKEFILSYGELNHNFIKQSEYEYDRMMEILEKDHRGSVTDLMKDHIGTHQQTFMYPILDRQKNKAFENLNLNVCYDFMFEKHGDQKD